MSLQERIINEFKKQKEEERGVVVELKAIREQLLTQDQVNYTMDKLCALNTQYQKFNREVAEQIWENTTKEKGKVKLNNYVKTIIQAIEILKDNIHKCQRQLEFQRDTTVRKELQQCYQSYSEDYCIITEPFKLQKVPTPNNSFSKDSFSKSKHVTDNESHIFTQNPSQKNESSSLKLVLIMTTVMLLLELLCMHGRHHFFNLLTYTTIMSIFILSYFDKKYMKFILIQITLSVVFDLLWAITHAKDYWNPQGQTQYSHLQSGFMQFIYLLTLLLMLGKVLIIVLLFRFRNNTEHTRKIVKIFNTKIYLDGKERQNPVSILLPTSKANTAQPPSATKP